MDIQLSADTKGVSWVELARVFELAPLGRKRDPEKVELAFRNSQLKVFAFEQNTLIGAGRALSDGVWRAAIYDVAVLPEYQGKGIGSIIIQHLLEAANVDVIMLYVPPGKEAFYERFGFKKMSTAMAVMPDLEERRKQGYLE
jgi:ribosomal protein S18 acetylase RimI-like enzyme